MVDRGVTDRFVKTKMMNAQSKTRTSNKNT
jgi:hypothetical protein